MSALICSNESQKNTVRPINSVAHLHHQPSMPVALGYSAVVLAVDGKKQSQYQLQLGDVQRSATSAEGLLVQAEVGDTVLCVEIDNALFITQVIQRAPSSTPLVMSSSRPIEYVAPVLRFKAFKEMELLSANKLTLSAADMVLGASRTFVQQARNMIQHAKNYSVTAKDLMRLNGRQQVIIAEDDIRMDAKRINMG